MKTIKPARPGELGRGAATSSNKKGRVAAAFFTLGKGPQACGPQLEGPQACGP
jgi:hypothetical protein